VKGRGWSRLNPGKNSGYGLEIRCLIILTGLEASPAPHTDSLDLNKR